MNEPDPFYIDAKVNEALSEPAPAEEEVVEATIAEEPVEATIVAESEEPVLIELEDLKLGPDEEHGFALIEQATTKPREQILLFAELGGLLRVSTDRVIEASHTVKKAVERKGKQFALGTLIALAWASGGAKPAEAFDWKRHLPTAVRVGAQVGGEVLAHKAREHAETARFLAEAPQRVERLKDRIDDIDGRIETATNMLKDPKETDYRKRRIEQDIGHMRLARAECISELLWLQHQLDRAEAAGMTAQSEAQKARNAALGADIAETVEREAAWSSMWGW
jgi:hypothetical protein